MDGKNLKMMPFLSRERNNNNKDHRDKNGKKTLNAQLNDLCILLIRIWILSSLITFFFYMPNLCSDLSDNQIENLPPGVFNKNTELTGL